MNAELSGLLEAIHERPGDGDLWLVLADWLEEHDDPRRATLLREVRGLRGVVEGEARLAAERRVQDLLLAGVVPCVPTRTNSVGMVLALIPAGAAWLGSPPTEEGRYGDEPRTRVELMSPFYLGVHAVTQAQYEAVMGDNPSAFSAKGRMRRKVEGLDTSSFPVERVSWNDAVLFCQRLGDLPEETSAGRTYRLPTEVEWEFACRGEASQMTPHPYGPTISPKVVNFRPSRRARGHLGRPAAVGSYPPNAFGLYEMVGNTWEWCEDWYATEAHGDKHADPPTELDRRNARGGTYALEARRARTADRSSFEPDHRDIDCGLRVLMPWPGKPAPKPGRKRR